VTRARRAWTCCRSSKSYTGCISHHKNCSSLHIGCNRDTNHWKPLQAAPAPTPCKCSDAFGLSQPPPYPPPMPGLLVHDTLTSSEPQRSRDTQTSRVRKPSACLGTSEGAVWAGADSQQRPLSRLQVVHTLRTARDAHATQSQQHAMLAILAMRTRAHTRARQCVLFVAPAKRKLAGAAPALQDRCISHTT
jgi:hypothetical protein